MFEFSTVGCTSAEQLIASGPAPGRYHVTITRVWENAETIEKYNAINLEFRVLNGTTPNQVGKSCRQFFSCKPGPATERLKAFAWTLGLIGANQKKSVRFGDAVGHELVIELETDEYENSAGKKKTGVRVPWAGFWTLDNPAVADVPRGSAAPPPTLAEQNADGDDPWSDV